MLGAHEQLVGTLARAMSDTTLVYLLRHGEVDNLHLGR